MTVYKAIIAGFALLLATALPSSADVQSEAFVYENAQLVLEALDDPSLDAAERTEKFNEYMNEFSNLNRISSFVIGKYSRRFSNEEKSRYRRAFRQYSLTAYETQFDEYRGSTITVTGSSDRNERDSIVTSILNTQDGDELQMQWRVLKRNDKLEVVDIGLNLDGTLLWLAIEQRAQFLDLLDRNNGSADALISKLEELTEKLIEENAAET